MKRALFIMGLLCLELTFVSCTKEALPIKNTKAENLEPGDGNLDIPIDEEGEPESQPNNDADDDCDNTSDNTTQSQG